MTCKTCTTCSGTGRGERVGLGDVCPLLAEELYPCCAPESVPSCPDTCCASDSAPNCPDTPREPDNCCCKGSMVEALRLLCGENISSVVNFDGFFFLTDSLAVGSPLSVPGTDTDNITAPTATLQRFSPCNCALLDVGGTAYFAIPGSTGVALEDVDQLSLCSLKAIAFQITDADCPRDCDDTNYDRAVRAIRRAIRAEGGNTGACGRCGAHCDCDDCCCAEGILNELSTRNLSRQVTLTAGPLVLQDVAVLGSVGSALVLASEALSRIYLICANAVEVIG